MEVPVGNKKNHNMKLSHFNKKIHDIKTGSEMSLFVHNHKTRYEDIRRYDSVREREIGG